MIQTRRMASPEVLKLVASNIETAVALKKIRWVHVTVDPINEGPYAVLEMTSDSYFRWLVLPVSARAAPRLRAPAPHVGDRFGRFRHKIWCST